MAAAAGQHWAQINEVSFIAGMRLLLWLARVFGRWPFRVVLYPVLLWYLVANPPLARRQELLKADGILQSGCWRPGRNIRMLRHFAAFGEISLTDALWGGSLDGDSVASHGVDLMVGQMPRAAAAFYLLPSWQSGIMPGSSSASGWTQNDRAAVHQTRGKIQ